MATAAMKSSLVGFALAMAASLVGVWLIGPNLGGAFWIVVVVALLAPIAASGSRDLLSALFSVSGVVVGVAMSATALLSHDAFSVGQALAVAAAAIALGASLAATVRLLLLIRFAPVLAGAVVSLLALAWLSWPVWLSPWLTFASSGDWATRLAAVHPLLSINAVVQQFGFWTQSKHIYRLTTVGQNFQVGLPSGVMKCAMFHLVIAVLVSVPLFLCSWVRPASAGHSKR